MLELIVLGALAYFLLGRKPNATSTKSVSDQQKTPTVESVDMQWLSNPGSFNYDHTAYLAAREAVADNVKPLTLGEKLAEQEKTAVDTQVSRYRELDLPKSEPWQASAAIYNSTESELIAAGTEVKSIPQAKSIITQAIKAANQLTVGDGFTGMYNDKGKVVDVSSQSNIASYLAQGLHFDTAFALLAGL